MPFTAAIAERLSLTYHSVLTADRLADKFLQRQALQDAGLPGPAAWEAPTSGASGREDARAIEQLAGRVTYPVVVKPRRGTSSVATARADDERQLSDLLTRFGAQEGGLVVEEYLADRVSEGLCRRHRGRAVGTGRAGLAFGHHGQVQSPRALPRPGMFPAKTVERDDRGGVVRRRRGRLRGFGITDGFANVDLKLTPEGPHVVEVNGRLGGNVHVLMELAGGPQICPCSSGWASVRTWRPSRRWRKFPAGNWPRTAYFAWIQTPMSATRLSAIEGLDDVAALPHVVSVTRNQRQGDELNWARGGRFNVSEVFGSVEDIGDLGTARTRSTTPSHSNSKRILGKQTHRDGVSGRAVRLSFR